MHLERIGRRKRRGWRRGRKEVTVLREKAKFEDGWISLERR
jgi:hypothetical protein